MRKRSVMYLYEICFMKYQVYFLLSNTNYNYMILKCIQCVLLSTDIANFEQLFTKYRWYFILRGSDVNYGTEDLKVTSRCQQT